MKSSSEIKREMYSEGWLPSEIYGITHALTPSGNRQKLPNIDSPAFLAMRRSRIRYIADLTRLGWTQDEIRWKLVQYHKSHRDDPFGFLKAEYRASKKMDDLSGAVALKQQRAWKRNQSSVDYRRANERRSLTLGLGFIYGRKLKRSVVARRAPNKPVLIIKRRKVTNNEG